MSRIRPVVRAGASPPWGRAGILALLLASCGAPQAALPAGTVEAAGEEVPEWVRQPETELCRPSEVCVVGSITGLDSRKEALRSARYDGYVQLAEQAFPVHVLESYKKERRNAEQHVSSDVASELMGRVRGAEVRRDFWVRRRNHSVEGHRDVFDGFALVAIDRGRLDGLYDAEVARAQREAAALGEELERARRAAREDRVAEAVARARDVRSRARDLQETPERDRLLREVEQLAGDVDHRVGVELLGATHDSRARTMAAQLRLHAGGAPLGGIPVAIRVDGAPLGGDHTVPSDGVLRVELPVDDLFEDRELDVRLVDLESIRRTVTAPAPYLCARWKVQVDIGGYSAGRGLHQRLQSLRAALSDRIRACERRGSAGRELPLEVLIRGHIQKPRRRTRRAWAAAGQLSVRFGARFASRLESLATANGQHVKGLGTSTSQLRSTLQDRIVDQVRGVLEEGLAQL